MVIQDGDRGDETRCRRAKAAGGGGGDNCAPPPLRCSPPEDEVHDCEANSARAHGNFKLDGRQRTRLLKRAVP